MYIKIFNFKPITFRYFALVEHMENLFSWLLLPYYLLFRFIFNLLFEASEKIQMIV